MAVLFVVQSSNSVQKIPTGLYINSNDLYTISPGPILALCSNSKIKVWMNDSIVQINSVGNLLHCSSRHGNVILLVASKVFQLFVLHGDESRTIALDIFPELTTCTLSAIPIWTDTEDDESNSLIRAPAKLLMQISPSTLLSFGDGIEWKLEFKNEIMELYTSSHIAWITIMVLLLELKIMNGFTFVTEKLLKVFINIDNRMARI